MNRMNLSFAVVIALIFSMPNLSVAQTPEPSAPTGESGPPLILAASILSTGQTLVWDTKAESYALLRLGQERHGYKVTRILRDGIVLHRDGKRYRLALTPALVSSPRRPAVESTGDPARITMLTGAAPPLTRKPKAEAKAENKVKAKAVANPKPQRAVQAVAASTGKTPTAAAKQPKEAKPELPSFRIGEVRAEVSEYVRGDSSYRVNLSRAGNIRLAGVNDKSLLHRLGLRDGDEIKTVAGVKINSRATAVDAYLSLRSGKTMDIVLIRDGKQQTVRVLII